MNIARRAALAPLIALLALAGCADILGGGGGDAFQRRKLAEARALWESRPVPSYRFDLDLVCACVPSEAARTVRVTVEGETSTVQFVSSSEDETETPPAVYQGYASVEKLFAAVENAIARDQQVLQVGYDHEYGFPSRMNALFSGGEQIVFVVANFQAPAP